MRSLYKGIIGFGLVSIPVQLFKAMDDERVELHYVHKACGSRIRYQKTCPVCQVTVGADDLAKGSELPDGRFVIVPEEEPTNPTDHTITILSFHALSDIDPVFYHQSYWVKAGPGAQKAYKLLADTMQRHHKVALAEMVLRSKTSLAVVRPFPGGGLMLHRMYYPESLRREGTAFGELNVEINEREEKMAASLIDEMTEPFVPASYPNVAKARLLKTIQQLMPQAITPQAEAPSTEVLSLMEQLKASLEKSKKSGAS